MRRAARWVKAKAVAAKDVAGRYPLTCMLLFVLVLGLVGLWRVETVAKDGVNRANAESNARLTAIEQLQTQLANTQQALEAETRLRTTENCENSARSRESNKQTFFGLINAFVPKDADGNPIPLSERQQATFDNLIASVEVNLPPLICPQNNGPIVIPVPSTTAP